MSIQLVTKFKIEKSAADIFEAFVNPSKICNFWFSGSFARWETGKTVTLEYVEYGATGFDIKLLEFVSAKIIIFLWGDKGVENRVTINFKEANSINTIVEIIEIGWNKDGPDLTNKLAGNKEGWVWRME